jgi:hypothetical protein
MLEFEQFEDENDALYISHYVSSFYAGQKPILKDRIRMALCALSGKEFRLYDVVLQDEYLEKFKEFCGEFSGRKSDKEIKDLQVKYKTLLSMIDV